MPHRQWYGSFCAINFEFGGGRGAHRNVIESWNSILGISYIFNSFRNLSFLVPQKQIAVVPPDQV